VPVDIAKAIDEMNMIVAVLGIYDMDLDLILGKSLVHAQFNHETSVSVSRNVTWSVLIGYREITSATI